MGILLKHGGGEGVWLFFSHCRDMNGMGISGVKFMADEGRGNKSWLAVVSAFS